MSQSIVGSDALDGLVPDFTKLESRLIEASLLGENIRKTSVRLRVPQAFIREFLAKKKVRAYIKEQKEIGAEMMQLRLQELLTDVVERRIKDAEGDISKLTKKDTLDVLRLLHDISSGIVKGSQVTEADDKYASILEKVFK